MSKKSIFKSVGSKVWLVVTPIVLAILIALPILAQGIFYPILGTVLGGKMPIIDETLEKTYVSDYESKEASTEAGNKLNVEIAEEGFTLLMNEDKALPIATPESKTNKASEKPKVSVFGKNSVNLVLGGSGSGGISGVTAATIYDGLEQAGFDVNPTLKSFYEEDDSERSTTTLNEASSEAPVLDIGETPVSRYSSEVRGSFAEYDDAALVVISRIGGESFDLPRFQSENGGIDGNHYLQLDQNEYDMLDLVTSKFDKVIVVLNTLTSFQCDFIAEYNNTATNKRIDAVLWIGGPGATGAVAIGGLLNGNVNPSGRTVDIYSKDFTKDPVWQNFGDNSQVNGGKDGSSYMEGDAVLSKQWMITYEEGVYTGYRYYETRAYEEGKVDPNSTWYEENVWFPFGYGLSYTQFDQRITTAGGSFDKDTKINISVEVENIGDVAGKDAIQLYVTLPYTQGGIEKSHVQLVDFAKTSLLEKNGKYTANFVVDAYDLASYDYNDANGNGFKGYEVEAGDYVFHVSSNSHISTSSYGSVTFTLAEGIQYEKDTTTNNPVINRYTETENEFDSVDYRLEDVFVEDADGKLYTRKGMSRTDFAGTFPKALTKAERALKSDKEGVSEKQTLQNYDHNNTLIAATVAEKGMPTTGADGTVTIRDLTGKPYNDKLWEELLDRLTFDQMLDLVNQGAFQTIAIESIDKNLTNDSDGPIGFVNFMAGKSQSYVGNTTFACEIVIGSTWNKDLAYRMGEIVGENGLWGDVTGNGLPYSGWYAPAVNLHRSPFSGRNFEYYSEDPILSGKMAVNTINGAAQKGVYTDLKHFALNDQETNRAGVSTFCTEQALREIYLKPFEIAVKGNDNPAEVASAKADGLTEFKGSMGIMSSFNRIGTKWTGGDYRLMTEILRNEWGFEGLVICDYKTTDDFMKSKQMLYAGNDLILASLTPLMWTDADKNSKEDVTILRQASHNILYAVANSNSINVRVIGYQTEWWILAIYAVDVVGVLALALWGFLAFRKSLRMCEEAPKKSGKKVLKKK